jgi:hypothetical protein
MITYILIGLIALSLFTLVSYFFAINIIYKKYNKESLNIRNTFMFEVCPQFKTDNFFIDVLLFISLASTLGGVIVFASSYLTVMPIVIAILSLIFLFCNAMIPFINIKFLKEHLYLNLGSIVCYFAISGLLTYLSYGICKLYDYQNVTAIIALVISALLLLGAFFFIFNPRIFDLKMDNKDGEVVRPKLIHLAFSEWLILFITPLILVPLILLSTIM